MAILTLWQCSHRTSQSARISARLSSERPQMLATLTVFLDGLRKLTLRLLQEPHQRQGPFSRIQVSRRRHIHSSWYWRWLSRSL